MFITSVRWDFGKGGGSQVFTPVLLSHRFTCEASFNNLAKKVFATLHM